MLWPEIVLRGILAITVLALLATIVPATAPAAEYTVNSTGDQIDEVLGSGGCKTAAETCTLRAAIEESNASTGVNDMIKFSGSFNGQIGDTIELATPLPTIIDRVRIEGSPTPLQCETDYFSLPGPCVGIDGPASGAAFRIEAERVVLIGLAISGAQTAIEAVGGPGLEAWNDWFGIKLDGSSGPVETGISVDQASNGPRIGGSSSVARDIFAHNTRVGLAINGADNADIRGNGFGVLPDGNTLAANGKNIEITDATTGDNRVAQGNWVGWTLNDEQLATPTCDGACNVIAGAAESGIDLVGDDPSEEPASGTTRIFGNYIGLNAFGTTGIPNAQQAVLVGSAKNVTIGGPRLGDRNMINGGENGVLAGPNAGSLTVENNWVGLDTAGTELLSPPTSLGIAIESGNHVEITQNRISMSGGTAIQQGAQEAVIRSNVIGEGIGGQSLPGGLVGIHLLGSCFICNLVYENSITNAADYGVLVENGKNRLYANRIEGSGRAGIHVEEPPPYGFALRNEIGGSTAVDENTISRNNGAAIEIAQITPYGGTRGNIVARNHGALNGGPFIDLVNDANEGILPPTFSSSTQSGASGDEAVPGAVVRVFRKSNDSPGEIAGFLGEVVADESGDWQVAYPSSVPGGTFVAASQTTSEQGTSELALATTTTEPAEVIGGSGEEGRSGGSGSTSRPPAVDTTPPQTILVKRPRKKSRSRTAQFKFTSDDPEAHFLCKLDRKTISSCSSPTVYKSLGRGWHRFKVWAVDSAGNRDASPAVAHFRVVKRKLHRQHTRHHHKKRSVRWR